MRKVAIALLISAPLLIAQQAPRVFTIQELFTRNVGSTEQQNKQFPPHKIIGNVYYVGTESLSSFLITTPQGHILINSIYERNVPTIQDSVQKLGFKFEDIKILLGSHAHGDHQEGDGLVAKLTGARAMAMAEDLPALQNMRSPGGVARPMYEVLHDGSEVKLGNVTLTASHTRAHAGLHDMDDEGPGWRPILRRTDHWQRRRESGHEPCRQSATRRSVSTES